LAPIAQAIVDKTSRAQKDNAHDYPMWQFKMDLARLKDEAVKIGATGDYADELYKSIDAKPKHDGRLICYYKDYDGFMRQWLILSCAVLIVVCAAAFKLTKRWVKVHFLVEKFAYTSVLGVSIWPFTVRPPTLPVAYWVLPGVVLIISAVILTLSTFKKENS